MRRKRKMEESKSNEIVIAHISDIHVGKWRFLPEKLERCIKEINILNPDAVVVTGDVTMFGFLEEYEEAKRYLKKLNQRVLVIPGNHDARYCGDKYFDKFFGFGNKIMNLSDEITIVGIDSSVPDLDEGTVGRGKQRWLRKQLRKIPKNKFKIVAIHHHIIPIPDTGRERNILTDSGDVLELLLEEGVDLVLCGHRHTPYVWVIEDLPIVTAGSPSSEKLRANIKNCYNIIKIKKDFIEIWFKEVGGKKKLIRKCKRKKRK